MDTELLDFACALAHDPTAERVLSAEFDELRWVHRGLRLCCGAFVDDDVVRFVASSEPPTMRSLAGACVSGEAVLQYRALLETVAELSSDELEHDARLADVPRSILGDDTRATVTLPLRAGRRTLGFVRIDAPEAGPISAKAVAALQAVTHACVLAVSLETELVLSQQRSRDLLQARRWIHGRLEHEHEAIRTLRATIDESKRTIEQAKLDETTIRALAYAIEDLDLRLEAFAAKLDRHAREAQGAAFFPETVAESLMRNRRKDLVETRPASDRSSRETPE